MAGNFYVLAKRNFYKLGVVGIMVFGLSSCKKGGQDESTGSLSGRFSIPASFSCRMSAVYQLTVSVSGTSFGDGIHILHVYDDRGALVGKGSARPGKPYTAGIALPGTARHLYVIRTGPDGSRTSSDVALSKTDLVLALSDPKAKAGSAVIAASDLERALDDEDRDGIPDVNDDFPLDADRAFVVPGPAGTLVFEDQWPKLDDYDLNDLVIGYTYSFVTDPSNNVKRILADFSLKATGGFYENGFGVELPMPRSAVASVSGAVLEGRQSKAVLILFNAMHSELPFWNVRPEDPIAEPKSYHVEIDLVPSAGFDFTGEQLHNPFIWNNGYGRGTEVHLKGYPPTSLADRGLFGTFNDRSTTENHYVSDDGLPWALDIPSSTFKHTFEGVSMVSAYRRFADWARSGGSEYRDWYSNTSSEYVDPGKLYTRTR